MPSLQEQIARKCIHLSGVMDKVCRAGVCYADVRVEPYEGPYKFPCLKQGGECSLAEFRTSGQIKDEVERIEGSGLKLAKAVAIIKDHYAKTKEQTGQVPCVCGGELHYIVVHINGHVWAKCNSCGIQFNE